MGDRISISFRKGDWTSVALFSHWDGPQLVTVAKDYVEDLKADRALLEGGNVGTPLARREPSTVMVDFIRYLTKDIPQVSGNYYLGEDGEDGDNSDNGHVVIDV